MLDKVIQKEVAYITVTQSQGEGESYKEDTRDVVADLLRLNLFQHVIHTHFERNISVKKPGNLKSRI